MLYGLREEFVRDTTVGLRRGTIAAPERAHTAEKRASISVRTYSTKLCILAVHLFHALAHLKDDGDAGDVHAQVAARLRMNSSRSSPRRYRAACCLGARRFEQALALIEAQSLGMNLVHLGHRRDHVRAFGFSFCSHGILESGYLNFFAKYSRLRQ